MPLKIHGSSDVFRLVNKICPEKWVHVKIITDIVYKNNFVREETICWINK